MNLLETRFTRDRRSRMLVKWPEIAREFQLFVNVYLLIAENYAESPNEREKSQQKLTHNPPLSYEK